MNDLRKRLTYDEWVKVYFVVVEQYVDDEWNAVAQSPCYAAGLWKTFDVAPPCRLRMRDRQETGQLHCRNPTASTRTWIGAVMVWA